MSGLNETLPPALTRRKKDTKRGITYTIMLVGKDGTGKTTFGNNLLESNIFPHRFMQEAGQFEETSKLTLLKPTKVVSYNCDFGLPTIMSPFDPQRALLGSGITITSTSVEIGEGTDENGDADENILLNVVNTHGIGENLNDQLCFDEIASYLQQEFDFILSEETRIRRNPRLTDGRVHVALYFIEPSGHGLKEVDVELMKRISRFTNVLPIIARADSFTEKELQTFKNNIMDDIEKYNVPVYKFEADPDDDDLETVEENQALAALQPFSIITSDTRDASGNYVRTYPWGSIKIDDDSISDLKVLKSVLFGSHLQEFKDTTQNLLYENYRAEKLSSVTSPELEAGTFAKGKDDAMNRASAAPSLSNFASLVNTGQFKSSQTLALDADGASTPELRETEPKKEDSPIRKMSQALKQENEKIIKNIKMESPLLNSSTVPEKEKLRNMSETVPYVLRHERIIARQQKLEELEAQSAKELQKRIQELEKKAQSLKLREKLLRQQRDSGSSSSFVSTSSTTQLKKEETQTDLASIVSGRAK